MRTCLCSSAYVLLICVCISVYYHFSLLFTSPLHVYGAITHIFCGLLTGDGLKVVSCSEAGQVLAHSFDGQKLTSASLIGDPQVPFQLHMNIYKYTSIHLSIYTSIHPYIHISMHPYIHASIHPYIYKSYIRICLCLSENARTFIKMNVYNVVFML